MTACSQHLNPYCAHCKRSQAIEKAAQRVIKEAILKGLSLDSVDALQEAMREPAQN